jgi:asparagine synthetase B (glutamine-hydrolysing)
LLERQDALRAHKYKERTYLQARGLGPFFIGADQRAAGFGVELRHPFWDSRVVEFFARVSPTVRIQGGREKVLLRVGMRGIAPDAVLARRHHGAFSRLVRTGYRVKETQKIEALLSTPHLGSLGVIDANTVRATYARYVAGEDSAFGRLTWTFLAERWLQERSADFGLPAQDNKARTPVTAPA